MPVAPCLDVDALNYAMGLKLKFHSLTTIRILILATEMLVNVGITIFLITNFQFCSPNLSLPFSLSSLLSTTLLSLAFATPAFKKFYPRIHPIIALLHFHAQVIM